MSDYDACPWLDEPSDVWRASEHVAHKSYRCDECDGPIRPGDRYQAVNMLYRGCGWETLRTCGPCLAGPVAFFKRNCPRSGRCIGGDWLYDHLREVFFEHPFRHPGVKFRLGRMLVEMRQRGSS